MSILKVVRIRSCSQCGKMLSDRCNSCIKHPDAKPRVIELFDFPKPFRVHSCGEHADFKCQNSSCGKVFMRYLKQKAKEKMTPFKGLFCSSGCSISAQNVSSKIAVKVKCSWDECGKEFERTPHRLSMSKLKLTFCKPECWHLYKLNKKEVHRNEENPTDAYLECLNGCREITQHQKIREGLYKCVPCGKSRKAADNMEAGLKA